MKHNKIWAILLTFVLVLAACGGESKAPEASTTDGSTAQSTTEEKGTEADKPSEPITLKVTTKFVDDEQTAISLKNVVQRVNERSNGSIKLELYTGGSLFIGKDGMEQVRMGSNMILVDGVNFLGDVVPDYNAVTGPFLYKTFDEYFKVVDSDIVKELNEKAEEQGIKVLNLKWVFGFRSMETNKPIEKPEDMKGLKIRVPTSQLYTYTLEAMGASPVSMPYPDTYAALQQGVIDGVEGSIMSYYGTKQYENVKDYSYTNHLLGVSAVCISNEVWNNMSEEQRTILQEEFDRGAEENLKETERLESEYKKELEEKGVRFHEADMDAFREATKSVFTKFDNWTPGIYDRILQVLGK